MTGIDLHVHTTASDGTLTGEEVIKMAIKLNLEGIAVTDHDTTRGLEEALIFGAKCCFPVIPGVELSTEHENKEIHILGYLFDFQLPWVEERLKHLQEARKTRIFKMVDKLSRIGYDISREEVLLAAGSGSLGRPHVAYVLLKKGYISTVQEAFHKLIGRGCPAFVPRAKITPEDAVLFIKKAGGIPVMAHPGLARSDDLIERLVKCGLMGIEVFHPDHERSDEEKFMAVAQKYRLIVTGGSDFHGCKDGSRFSLGSRTVSVEILERFREIKKGQLKDTDK